MAVTTKLDAVPADTELSRDADLGELPGLAPLAQRHLLGDELRRTVFDCAPADLARSLVFGTLPANDRVAMVTVAGGVGVLMTDDANRRGVAALAGFARPCRG